MNTKPHLYLAPSACVNSGAPSIKESALAVIYGKDSNIDRAVALYYYVRDSFSYNPYTASVEIPTLQATHVLETREGWCVSKAVLLAALCRSINIPARLGFADVVNHLSTEKLRKSMKTDVFYYHGYCSIYLNDAWVKATPAFNLSLCEKFHLKPLEFDGRADSLYHAFDKQGNRHMEYVRERGEFLDVPIEEMRAVFAKHYPKMSGGQAVADDSGAAADENATNRWEREVELEVNA